MIPVWGCEVNVTTSARVAAAVTCAAYSDYAMGCLLCGCQGYAFDSAIWKPSLHTALLLYWSRLRVFCGAGHPTQCYPHL